MVKWVSTGLTGLMSISWCNLEFQKHIWWMEHRLVEENNNGEKITVKDDKISKHFPIVQWILFQRQKNQGLGLAKILVLKNKKQRDKSWKQVLIMSL